MVVVHGNIIFSPTASPYMAVMTVLSMVSMANGGLSEIRGKHVQYSKFWNSDQKSNKELASRSGMVLAYTPCCSLFFLAFNFPNDGLRFMLLASALALHFFKRVSESLIIHSQI